MEKIEDFAKRMKKEVFEHALPIEVAIGAAYILGQKSKAEVKKKHGGE